MRLLVVNPGTATELTERVGSAARAIAAADTEIQAVNPPHGPATVESFYDQAFAVPALLTEVSWGEARGCEGAVIASLDDVGIDAARSLVRIPVVGLGEAALLTARLLGARTTLVLPHGAQIPAVETVVERHGLAGRCRVRAVAGGGGDLGPGALDRVRDEIVRALEEDRAESIILGYPGLIEPARRLAAEFQVPVIEGLAAAVKLVEGLVAQGLRTAKSGFYAPPRPKPYAGAFAQFAPRGGGQS